jgi:hypothetical protein
VGSESRSDRTPARAEPRVKGVAFRTIDDCFGELCGAAARERAASLMPPTVAESYRFGTLLSASWYPISWYRQVLQAFRASTNAGPDLPRRIGAMAVRLDMQGAHKRFVAWLVSPQSMLALSQRLFSTYYDTGRIELIESRRGFARVRAFDCFGWDQNMWSELMGSSGALLEESGAEHVRVRGISGGRDGDDHLEFESHWVI